MSVYDLESVSVPAVKGRALRWLAAALENPATRPLLLPRLIRQAGIPQLRQMGIQDAPTFLPLVPGGASPDPNDEHECPLLDEPATSEGKTGLCTARDIAHAYRVRETTPEQVAQRLLQTMEDDASHARPLRALIDWNKDDLIVQALESTQRIAQGQARSLLEGVPVAIKDEVDQVPYATRVGTRLFGTRPATTDATVVARLRAAGALLFGKSNMHEIGIDCNGQNIHFGTARNPYDRLHDTGGSSSGSAAAVAAGYCPVALGADGGGSIRIPAAFCGVVGLKPTFGRISEFGAAPLCWSLAHLGPIGATIDDVAMAYALMGGPDNHDPVSLHQPPPRWKDWDNADLSGLRVGIYRPWFEDASAEVIAANDAAVKHLTQAGAELHDIEIPELNGMRIAHAITIISEMAASMNSLGFKPKGFAPSTRVSLAVGRAFRSTDYVIAQRMRTRALRIFADLFEQVDLIVTPATPTPAPTIPEDAVERGWSDHTQTSRTIRFTAPANLAGLPAISLPVGYAPNGLPIGMQLMAGHWREDLLLRAGKVVEDSCPRRVPDDYLHLLPGATAPG